MRRRSPARRAAIGASSISGGDGLARTLIWSDARWRDRYFPGPRRSGGRVPPGWRSQAMAEIDEAYAERERRWQAQRAQADAQVQALADRERAERLTAIVEQYGSRVVEAVKQ